MLVWFTSSSFTLMNSCFRALWENVSLSWWPAVLWLKYSIRSYELITCRCTTALDCPIISTWELLRNKGAGLLKEVSNTIYHRLTDTQWIWADSQRPQGYSLLFIEPCRTIAVLHYWLPLLELLKSQLHLVTVWLSLAVQLHCEIKRGTARPHFQVLHTPQSTPIRVDLFSFITLSQAAASLLLLAIVVICLSLSFFLTPSSFLCFICIITASWLNLVKLSFGAAGGGRFAGSWNQYWEAIGPLWKSSGTAAVDICVW